VTIVDIQFSPANTDWSTLRFAAQAAQERGYGALWVLDHLAGLPLGGTSMIDAFTLLGALAEATDRIELGTMVANAWNRQIGTLVSAVASVALIADRQVHFGVGAGSAPGSRWAAEQHAVDASLEPDLWLRQQRVAEVLALAAAEWADDRDERFATFPLPRPRPTTIVGANSEALCRLAGQRADGVNIVWRHARRDALIESAREAAGTRPFSVTTYAVFDRGLLDPDHPDRVEMRERGVDRVVLAVFDDLSSWLSDTHVQVVSDTT
jgi:alkanesulfonate monooxygenase SsuD/methylene tetrahydromethanopterin reductase-like flavin-dependent oxidoreductase (luciferase family)